MQNDLNLYVQFSKKDDSQHIVEGYASTEDLDSQGEIVRFDAIKKALPDYMKFGNIREMHQHSAVGKAVKAIPDEKRKGLYLVARIVDTDAWTKVQEGVYNGFSIGGRVLKQVGNEIHDLVLNEISVVDRPANPGALFSLVKFDGKGGDNMDLKDKKVKKDVTEESEDTDGGEDVQKPDHMEVFRAGNLISIAADLCMLYDLYEMNGMDATNLDKAIELLKEVVAQEMQNPNADTQQTQKVLDTLNAFQKKKLNAEDRKNLSDSDYAYIDSKGGRHLPINDEAHVRAAMARFDQTQFESDDAKRKAAKKIIAAAKKHGIEVDPKSTVATTAKRSDMEEVKYLFRSDSWMSGYFDQVHKILG